MTDMRDTVVAGRRPVLEALKAGRSAERVLIARELAPSSIIGAVRRRAERASIPVRVVPKEELDRRARGLNHQGVVALGVPFRYVALDAILSAPEPAVLFLDGVTDPHNLGSLLRSAEAADFDGVVIPSRRAAGVTASVRRVSAGAAEIVSVARVVNLSRALDDARTKGVWVVGLDASAPDDIWTSDFVERPVGLVLGSEDRGLSKGVRGHCDAVLRIPARGKLGSLNVASAGAVAMFEVARRRHATHG
jgi:23S rRNA (guanosine2251-2'-O)-methyltransferase